ncbi:MAG: poly-gamma-glutamate system protein [Deltaproteobacteria bacterium]|nr:poly-gamma-glutamate system protein [Deltaproteobacteria bacterium]
MSLLHDTPGVAARGDKITRREALVRVASLTFSALVVPSTAHSEPAGPSPLRCSVKAAALEAAVALRKEVLSLRVSLGYSVDTKLDPSASGLIGLPDSSVTSAAGDLADKRISASLEWPIRILELFAEAGVGPGAKAAVCWSGSYPAANIALSAAMKALDINPICIASAASSQYGANFPDLLWLDMERLLPQQIVPFRSSAASLGGRQDNGLNVENPKLLSAAIKRCEIEYLKCRTTSDGIDSRLKIFSSQNAGPGEADIFINVGGGSAAIGGTLGRELPTGLFPRKLNPHITSNVPDCLALRYHKVDTPVLNLRSFRRLTGHKE